MKKNEFGRACSTYGGRRSTYRIFMDYSEGKRPHGRPGHRSKDNIKLDLQRIGLDGLDWIELVQDWD